MLIAWFVVSVLVTTIAILATAQNSLAFIKGFRKDPSMGLLVIGVYLLFLLLLVLGVGNLVQHYSHDSQQIRCQSIEGSVYDRAEQKCYVNGEEK